MKEKERMKKNWPYNGDVNNPLYMKERSALFKKHGNGWWWYAGIRRLLPDYLKELDSDE